MSAFVCGIADPYVLEFNYDHTGPVIRQADDPTAGVTGDDLLIHAQDVSSNVVAPTGGGIIVRSGGDAGAALNPSSGDVEIYMGAQGGAGARGTMYVGRPAVDAGANRPTNQYFSAQGGTFIQNAGSNTIYTSNVIVQLYRADLTFQSAVAGPTVSHAVDATAGVTGDDLTIRAQDVSGAGGPTGGGLILRSGGDSGAATNPSSGDVELYTGAFGGTGTAGQMYLGRDAASTVANRASYAWILAASTIRLQIGGGTKWVVTSTYSEISGADIRFSSTTVAPVVYQQDDNTAGITGDDLTVHAQDVGDPAGNATGGNLGLRGGLDASATGNAEGNVWFHAAAANYQGMELGIFVGDCGVVPGGNPANGGFLYSNAGAGTWRGSGGTITAFGPADQHCEKCGYDFWTNHYENHAWGAYLKQCGMCGEIYKSGPKSVLAKLTAKQKKLMVRHKQGEWS